MALVQPLSCYISFSIICTETPIHNEQIQIHIEIKYKVEVETQSGVFLLAKLYLQIQQYRYWTNRNALIEDKTANNFSADDDNVWKQGDDHWHCSTRGGSSCIWSCICIAFIIVFAIEIVDENEITGMVSAEAAVVRNLDRCCLFAAASKTTIQIPVIQMHTNTAGVFQLASPQKCQSVSKFLTFVWDLLFKLVNF